MRPEILVAEVESLSEALAGHLARKAAAAHAAGRRFTLAVPGGSVATAFFPRLARMGVDWSRVEIFTTDERAVPPSSAGSNFGTAQRLWFAPAGVPPERTHRMAADRPDLAAASEAYARALEAAAGTPPRLDLVLLGVGPDGHVASLFPGHPLLDEGSGSVAFLTDAPKPPPRRMTLTLPALCAARQVVVAAFGGEKAGAVAGAVDHRDPALPLTRVLERAERVSLLLDPGAASRLAGRGGSGPGL